MSVLLMILTLTLVQIIPIKYSLPLHKKRSTICRAQAMTVRVSYRSQTHLFVQHPRQTSVYQPLLQMCKVTTLVIYSHIMYRLCGENIDKTVKQQYMYMRFDTPKTKSLHSSHLCVVANRINFTFLSEMTPPIPSVNIQQLAIILLHVPCQNDVALSKQFSHSYFYLK